MQTIVLIGPKHSGKTSAGRALASLCQCGFIDLDDFISQREGKSPRELFKEGQAVFQKAEAEAAAALFGTDSKCADSADFGADGKCAEGVNSTCAKARRVIAAGGGIIDNAEAVSALKSSGAKSVYLDISAESAWDRIAKAADGELPPFLQTDNSKETHRALHERRATAYLQFADIVIKAEGKTPQEIADEISSRIS